MKEKKGEIRIISGKWKGKKILFNLSSDLRPTPDRAKETLFNWLGQDLKNLNQGMLSIYLSQLINSNNIIVTGSKNRYRDFIYIDDAIEAIFKTLKSKKSSGEIINIGSGKPKKIKDLIKTIVRYIGKGKPIFSKIKFRSDELLELYPNISKAKKILKWRPKIDFKKGIKKTIKFYSINKNEKIILNK